MVPGIGACARPSVITVNFDQKCIVSRRQQCYILFTKNFPSERTAVNADFSPDFDFTNPDFIENVLFDATFDFFSQFRIPF